MTSSDPSQETATPARRASRRRKLLVFGSVVLALVAGAGMLAWAKLFRVVEQPDFENEESWFRHGSLGGEEETGFPYYVWLVMPRIFPDLMPGPGGYRSFGFAWSPGEELPAGFSLKTVGFPRVTNNCAMCHTASWRRGEDDDVHFVAGAPGHQVRFQAYVRFLADAAKDPRFNPDTILEEIRLVYDDGHGHGGLSWLDRQLYRRLIVPRLRDKLLEMGRKFAWMDSPPDHRPGWGTGRDDSMNLPKYFLAEMDVDGSIGSADFAALWNLKAREGMPYQWDGTTPALRSVIVDSGIGVGLPADGRLDGRVERMAAYLRDLKPPPFPDTVGPHGQADRFPLFRVDAALAARGRDVWARECAACHDAGGARLGSIVPLEEIKTDSGRLDAWTEDAVRRTNAAIRAKGYDRPDMVKTHGYMAQPLDGVWLRAPYLHNGSVPTLDDLLRPAAERPTEFFTGYDVYDAEKVGFVTSGAEARQAGVLYSTRAAGNGNGGHEYGTRMPQEDRRSLLEYLKTR